MSDELYPVEVTIRNLYCFKGSHTFQLGPNVYAVLARAEDNPQRSNWLGKSTLLMAFAFALFGWHTKRTDDQIITTGEDEAEVSLKLSDGSVLGRIKRRGASVQVRFKGPKAKRPITQARAAEAIVQHIGFSKDDFFATYFFEQKKIGALVTAGAADRIAMVEGWLADELEPMQRLHAAAAKAHKDAVDAKGVLEREMKELQDDFENLMTEHVGKVDYGVDMLGTLDDLLKKAEAEWEHTKRELAAARDVAQRAGTWADKQAQADEYDAIIEQGTALRATFDAIPADIEAQKSDAERACGAAITKADETAERYRNAQRSDYEFDGKCPVACGDCPSAQWVKDQATSPQAVADARAASQGAAKARDEARAKLQGLAAQARQRASLDVQLTQLRTKAEALADVAEEVELFEAAVFPEDPEAEVQAAEAKEDADSDVVKQLRADREWLEKCGDRVQELRTLIAEASTTVQVAKDAVDVTGRTGGQQAIQELVMAQVETKANKLLTDAGIPLSVGISWEQETKGLAKVCPECGTAFPTSQRVKVCGACGAQRGPNVQRKLSIEPSNRSGAAEDLAGVALGIAASKWLRARRGARWSAVFIDEPFGALDPHNRHALGSHITHMLKTSYSCALVVAHQREILSAMPGRINIVSGADGWSRIEGVS